MSENYTKQDLFYHIESKSYVSLLQDDGNYQLSTSQEAYPEFKGVRLSNDSIKDVLRGDVYILDSVKSGTGRNPQKDIYQLVFKPSFELLSIPYTYIKTTSLTSVKEFAQSLKAKSEATVIFISGDTSVGEFVNGLDDIASAADINVFIVPAGTGNSFSYSIGIYDTAEAVRRLFAVCDRKPLNLYEATFPEGSVTLNQDSVVAIVDQPLKFLVVLSWAFHAALVADSDTPELRKYGVERFKMAAQSNLSSPQIYRGSVKVGNKLYEGPFAYLIFTPSVRFEKNFNISPHGDVFKNNIYLISFKPTSDTTGDCIMDIMGKVYDNGKHIEDDRVTYDEILKEEIVLKVETPQERKYRRICIDGATVLLPESGENEIKLKCSGNIHKNRNFFLLV